MSALHACVLCFKGFWLVASRSSGSKNCLVLLYYQLSFIGPLCVI